MVNGALLERVRSGAFALGESSYANLTEVFPIGDLPLGARFLDLGGSRPQVGTYLHKLERSFIVAASTAFISMMVVVFVTLDFSWSGSALLSPVETLFIGVMAFSMAIVALFSCLVSIKYFKQTIRVICPS